MPRLEIKSRRDPLKVYGKAALLLTCGSGFLVFLIDDIGLLVNGKTPDISVLILVLFSAFFIWAGFDGLIDQVSVSPESISIWQSRSKPRTILLKNVAKITYVPYSHGYMIGTEAEPDVPKDRGQIFPMNYENRDQIVRAIIEAAWLSNQNVSIDSSLIRTFGKPPYGIFVFFDESGKSIRHKQSR